MKILYVSAEVSPFSVSGGLGDVMGALPEAVAKAGESVSVISPLYSSMDKEYLSELNHVGDLSFKLGWRKTGASVYMLSKSGVDWYFVENKYYFNRERLYGEYDDGERFAFFSLSVLEFILKFMDDIDILHTNDWHTALCNVYLKTLFSERSVLCSLKTVFTIHNIQYQGIFDNSFYYDVIGLDAKYRSILDYEGKINLMKGALICADKVTTVSERYAEELQFDYFSYGLSPIIRASSDKLCGIVNGIDYKLFSPKSSDAVISFSKRDFVSGKLKNKKAVFDELKINARDDIPLAVMITRLTEQKGIDLVLRILDELLSERITVIVLGSGDKKYEEALLNAADRYENLIVKIGFERELSKKLYASADLFLMPSKTEPCGLAQMIACSFGAIPVVHSVGGLADTIIPYDKTDSNGFAFENYNAHDFLYAVKNALKLMSNRSLWRQLVQRAMSRDFSWNSSAQKYLSVYKELN